MTITGTEQFTRTIAEYLNRRAMTDPLFVSNLQKPHKKKPNTKAYQADLLATRSEVPKSNRNLDRKLGR